MASIQERKIFSPRNLTRTLLALAIATSLGEVTPTLAQAALKTIQIEGQVNQAFPQISSDEEGRIAEQVVIFERRARNAAAEAARKGESEARVPIGDLDKIDQPDIRRKRNEERQALQVKLEEEAGIPQQKARLIGGMVATAILAIGALKSSQSGTKT